MHRHTRKDTQITQNTLANTLTHTYTHKPTQNTHTHDTREAQHLTRNAKVHRPPHLPSPPSPPRGHDWKQDRHLSIKNQFEGPTCEAEGIIVAFGLLRICKGGPRHGMARGQAAHGIKNGAEGAGRLGVPDLNSALVGRGHISNRPPETQHKHHF